MTDKKIRTVTLEQPIRREGENITTLQIRKPDAGELRGVSLIDLVRMDVGALLTVIPRVAMPSIISEEAAALDPADLMAIGAEISDFFMTSADRKAFPQT